MGYAILGVAAALAFILSTLSGGGAALMMVPITSFFLGAQATAPVINLGNMIGRPVRLVLFWKDIDWEVVRYYVPSAIVGSFLGAWVFSSLRLEWLQIVIGIFLVSTIFQYRFGNKKRSFVMKNWYFIPVAFCVTFFSALIGATGAIMNPFYLNHGLIKESLIGTKTINSFLAGISAIGTYTYFGALHGDLWWYGLVFGIGAGIGNYIGKIALGSISSETFRKLVIAMMVISGALMIGGQVGKYF